MKKTLLVIGVGVVVGVAAYVVWSLTHAPAALNPDLYPLYQAAQWGPIKTATADGAEGSQVLSVPTTNITNIAASSTPFEAYYQSKLTQAGWVQDTAREASGPGSEVSVYTKGNQFIIVSYTTTFKNVATNTPAQCPCDLQLSLISGTAQ